MPPKTSSLKNIYKWTCFANSEIDYTIKKKEKGKLTVYSLVLWAGSDCRRWRRHPLRLEMSVLFSSFYNRFYSKQFTLNAFSLSLSLSFAPTAYRDNSSPSWRLPSWWHHCYKRLIMVKECWWFITLCLIVYLLLVRDASSEMGCNSDLSTKTSQISGCNRHLISDGSLSDR